jgi:hypothetical protein
MLNDLTIRNLLRFLRMEALTLTLAELLASFRLLLLSVQLLLGINIEIAQGLLSTHRLS